jgi:hypothetical protein
MRKQKVGTPFKVLALMLLLVVTVSATLTSSAGLKVFLISSPAYMIMAFVCICALFDLIPADGRKSADPCSPISESEIRTEEA